MEQLILVLIVLLSGGYIFYTMRRATKKGSCTGCSECNCCSMEDKDTVK